MSKDKILVVSNMYPDKKHPNYGVFVENFCKQINMCGISYDLSVLKKQDSKMGKILHYVLFLLRTVWKCFTSNYKYVYVHYISVSSIPIIWVAKFKKMRIIVNAHGTDIVPENERQEACQSNTRKILGLAEKIVVPSDYFKEYVVNKYGTLVLNKEIIVYPSGGIDDKVFFCMDDKKQIYEKYGLDTESIYMGYCGRISKTKGIDTLLEAIKRVSPKYEKLRILIVGSGEYESEMEQRIKLLGLSEIIIRFPMVSQSELCEIYNVIEAFLFPTEGESLGLVAIEAMACGTPVIASDCTAPQYYIKDGVNGFKFPKGDYEKLAKTIELFCDEYLQNSSLIEGAKKTADAYKVGIMRPKLMRILE